MLKAESPPSDPIKRKEFFRHFRSTFSSSQLEKYHKWFSLMDFDGSGKISCQELTTTLLSAGILKNKKEVYVMFRYADVDYSQDISLDEFLYGIVAYSKAKQIPLHHLEEIVEETNLLSKETLISQQRRGVLIQYVLNNSIIRDRVVDRTVNSNIALGDRRQKYRKMSSIGTLSRTHEVLRQKCADAVQQIEYIVRQSAAQLNKVCNPLTNDDDVKSDLSIGVTPSLENVLSPKLLPLVNQPVWQHYSATSAGDTITTSHSSHSDLITLTGSEDSVKYQRNLSCVLSDHEAEDAQTDSTDVSSSWRDSKKNQLKPLDSSLVSRISLTPNTVTHLPTSPISVSTHTAHYRKSTPTLSPISPKSLPSPHRLSNSSRVKPFPHETDEGGTEIGVKRSHTSLPKHK